MMMTLIIVHRIGISSNNNNNNKNKLQTIYSFSCITRVTHAA